MLRVWTIDELSSLLRVSKNWLYRNWKSIGLRKVDGLRHLRFTDNSVRKILGDGE